MAKTFHVYVSSTFADLEEHRRAVYQYLSKVKSLTVVAMEDYVATDQRPLDKCLADVAACDIYVGIFAQRYGFIPDADNPDRKSITELEFRHAKALGKHCLIFVLDENAPWILTHTDSYAEKEDRGARIAALRKHLLANQTVSQFRDAPQLAALVNAAIVNYITAQNPDAGRAEPEAPVQVRELRNSLYLAFSPLDGAMARALAPRLGAASDKPILLAPEALFADTEADYQKLERGVTRAQAALALITPGSLGQLTAKAPDAASIFSLMQARTGAFALLLAGVASADLPADWRSHYVAFELAPDPVAATNAAEASLTAVRQWCEARLPNSDLRTVGIPMCALVMDRREQEELDSAPDFIARGLGTSSQQQYDRLKTELDRSGVPWRNRYDSTREQWRPFDPAGARLTTFIADFERELNQRSPAKLRHRQVKIQWYPFSAALSGDPRLRRIYRDVANAGGIVLVDEISLFHPMLRAAFQNSPFFNNDRVGIVSVSPFDPGLEPRDQPLEAEIRRKLAGAFDRYAVDCDPQCELAVGDANRLRRWLHASLPEAVTRLQELQPDQDAIRQFFGVELGASRRGRRATILGPVGGEPDRSDVELAGLSAA